MRWQLCYLEGLVYDYREDGKKYYGCDHETESLARD